MRSLPALLGVRPRPATVRLVRRLGLAAAGVLHPAVRSLGLRPRPATLDVIRHTATGRSGPAGVVAAMLGLSATVVVLAAAPSGASPGTAHRPHPTDPAAGRRPLAAIADAQHPVNLAPASVAPAPPPPAVAGAALRPHEIFGFAPYWTLDQSSGFDLHSLSTLAYFGVDVAPDGSLVRSGGGWDGYQSQDLATLITRAHAANVHVVLTVKNFDNGDLHALVSTPGAVDRLAAQLTEAIRSKNMDGANLDFEGTGGGDRAGYAAFASTLARTLHAANPNWQVTIDTYASSASDTTSFFDVPAIAPAVDAFFVMAYDMYGDGSKAQPNAPLANYGFNDTAAMSAYTAVVPASKVLLGTPFYGYDFTVADNTPNSKATGTPAPQTYAEVRSSGHPLQWDTAGSVPFVSYQGADGAWHEVYFDNPQSLALKAQLVNRFQLRGLGVWALGMDGNDPAMMAALLGHAAPLKLGPVVNGSASVLPPSSPPGAASSQPGAPPPAPSSAPASGSGSGSPKPSASPSPSGSGSGTPSPSGGGGGPSPPPPPPPPTTPPTPPPLPTLG